MDKKTVSIVDSDQIIININIDFWTLPKRYFLILYKRYVTIICQLEIK